MKKPKPQLTDATARPFHREESSTVAWKQNPQAEALRVDLENGVFFVLPYSHFAFAHFARERDRETLRVSFTTHDVRVSGRNLRDLGLALQKLAVDWIREIPVRYVALAQKGGPCIERIEVTKVSEDDSSPS